MYAYSVCQSMNFPSCIDLYSSFFSFYAVSKKQLR